MNNTVIATELVKIAKELAADGNTEHEYRAITQEAEHLLNNLLMAMKRHSKLRERDELGERKNWGYIGDMGRVVIGLRELTDFLNSPR